MHKDIKHPIFGVRRPRHATCQKNCASQLFCLKTFLTKPVNTKNLNVQQVNVQKQIKKYIDYKVCQKFTLFLPISARFTLFVRAKVLQANLICQFAPFCMSD